MQSVCRCRSVRSCRQIPTLTMEAVSSSETLELTKSPQDVTAEKTNADIRLTWNGRRKTLTVQTTSTCNGSDGRGSTLDLGKGVSVQHCRAPHGPTQWRVPLTTSPVTLRVPERRGAQPARTDAAGTATRRRRVVSFTPRPFYPRERNPVSLSGT
jgi:hypothetical protein